MTVWSPDLYVAGGRAEGVPDQILFAVLDARAHIQLTAPSVTPLLTLGHLGHVCQLSYAWLRAVVERTVDPYFTFEIPKRRGGKRTIHVPERRLLSVQRWLNSNVLQGLPVHECAYAYRRGSTLRSAVELHTNARWMIKIDLVDFFHSINTQQVFNVFRRHAGFPALLSFELARICTVDALSGQIGGDREGAQAGRCPYPPRCGSYMPIGAPTSPMISNVVMRDVDHRLAHVASTNGARYGRYADDLVFTSVTRKFARREVSNILAKAKAELVSNGFMLNRKKLVVLPPGTRKIFLGVDVTGSTPRIPHELRRRIREHYHFIEKYGAASHGQKRRFASVSALERYLWGVISFVNQIEPRLGAELRQRHKAINWPPF